MNRDFPKELVQAAGDYLKRHPEELVRAARNAVALRLGVPIAALRWLAGQLRGAKAPRDITIEARPPGIHVAASIDLMKTAIRAAGTVAVESLDLGADSLVVQVRVTDISLTVLDDDADTPIAALLRSGALDLSRPGDLVAYMPKRPAFLVAAEGNRITLDLMKHPELSAEMARRIVSLVAPLVSIDAIRTDDEHLDISFNALPGGVGEVVATLRRLLGA